MGESTKRWLATCLLSVVAIGWLVWAFPRLHPAARLGLRFDRDGYLTQARQIAAGERIGVDGWRGYVKAETLADNQELQFKMPSDDMAHAFPDAQVLTNFLPLDQSAGAKVTMRPDGRPLSWKLPVATAGSAASARAMADQAMHEMETADSSRFSMTSDGVSDSNGTTYKWKRTEQGSDMPQLGVEESVKNGAVWQAKTVFTLPEAAAKQFDAFPLARVIASCAWSLFLLAAMAVAILREGSGSVARAMKDRSGIWISTGVGLLFAVAEFTEWDDEMISVPVATGVSTEVLGLVLGAVIVGLMFYSLCAATVLNARLHAGRVRGFRLLGSRAFFSQTVGAEFLGGWLLSPVVVSLPLLVGAVMRKPAFGGFDDSLLLNRVPVLHALLGATGQETAAVIALLGALIPLAIRFSKPGRKRQALIALFAIATFAMLDAPFREAQSANLICAALNGVTLMWLYTRFGMLGALSAHCSARAVTAAGVLMVQPAASLHADGWGIVLALGGLGLLALAAATKGPEAVAELYGESGVRLQARSRREELLAEFNVARSAQQQMLPSEPPVLAGYTIAASCEPAREVGGDLYDFLRLDDGRWGIGVADVSGKGVPAALYMTLTKGLLCAAAQDSGDPRQILAAVNKHLRTVTKRKMFVTMAFGVLDPAARRLEYVRAGHNPVVWRRPAAGETRFLGGNGIGLGIAGPALFAKTLATETLDLEPGDALVFYSDGLTEAMNEGLEQFGEERLAAAVERADGTDATATRDSILEEVSRFLDGGHSQDDLTIAVLRVDANGISNGG
jgi:serine phosphatase RsbU (regulator of sigma subunit)